MEPKNIFSTVNRKVGKAIKKYDLIKEGDRVLVGLSGGKDSMVLLKTLAGRLKYSREKFELAAAHIGLKSGTDAENADRLKAFTEQLKVRYIHKTIDFELPDDDQANPCFECSRNRRKALFDIAQQIGFNQLALGHHMDDAIETLLMNMFFQSSISSMPPKLEMFEGKLNLIRPLILLTENEIKEFAFQSKFEEVAINCGFEKNSQRNEMKKLISQLSIANPKVRTNIYASMTNIQVDYLPKQKY
jgi:tRNA(Ile)-lysidine synthetase-like protein